MPIFIPDLFSSYVQGRRAAIQDNWNDLTNYNKTLGGQLQNAYDMQTFGDNAQISRNNALTSNQRTALGGMVTDQALMRMAEEIRLGVPIQQALANYQTAIASQSASKFNTSVYNDPNYVQRYVNGVSTDGTTADGTANGQAALEDNTTVPSLGNTSLGLNKPSFYDQLTPASQHRVDSLMLQQGLTQEEIDRLAQAMYDREHPQQPQQPQPLQ